ncbi:MAG: hypothetical protein HQK54_14075 [Oligoflexales bacterium]|nr:hypothetical protein [Oligoflexales bacterium]
MINRVEISRFVQKQLKKMPRYIVENLAAWVDDVENRGLDEVRKTPGYHDEPLKGARLGQRSIRLSGSYRAIYIITASGEIEFVSIMEVTKHAY